MLARRRSAPRAGRSRSAACAAEGRPCRRRRPGGGRGRSSWPRRARCRPCAAGRPDRRRSPATMRDADAGADEDLVAHQLERLARARCSSSLADVLGGADIPDVDQDDGELVAAEPRHGVDFADARFAAGAAVWRTSSSPAGWPSVSLTCLEAVEVDIEQRDLAACRAARRRRARFSRSSNSARLGRPVSVSWKARYCAWSWLRCSCAGGAAQPAQQETQHAGREQQRQDRSAGAACLISVRPGRSGSQPT